MRAWSSCSSNQRRWLESTMIHSILPVQFTCLTDFAQPLSKFFLVCFLAWHPPLHTPFLHTLSSFCSTCPYHHNLFCSSTKIMSSIPSLSLNSLLGTLMSHIHLTISISACWSATSCSFLTGQVSLPCNILLVTKLLYSLPHIQHPFNGPLGVPGWAVTRNVKTVWILLKWETVSGSGISWAMCKSAPRPRQITTPAPHNSVFYRPDALLAPQPTASKHWRHSLPLIIVTVTGKLNDCYGSQCSTELFFLVAESLVHILMAYFTGWCTVSWKLFVVLFDSCTVGWV